MHVLTMIVDGVVITALGIGVVIGLIWLAMNSKDGMR